MNLVHFIDIYFIMLYFLIMSKVCCEKCNENGSHILIVYIYLQINLDKLRQNKLMVYIQ